MLQSRGCESIARNVPPVMPTACCQASSGLITGTILCAGVLHGGRPGREAVYLKQRRGFIRVAIQTGTGVLSTCLPSRFQPSACVIAAAKVTDHENNLMHTAWRYFSYGLCPQTPYSRRLC